MDIDSDAFVDMMLLDACFIFELLRLNDKVSEVRRSLNSSHLILVFFFS